MAASPWVRLAGTAILIALAILVWLMFFTPPMAFRPDCEQTGPSSWVCEDPI